MTTARKEKACKACFAPFVPHRMGQKGCSPECEHGLARAESVRKERRAAVVARQKAKPRAQWLKEAQTAFNAWIRQRDEDLPCISCGRWHQGQWHAGHYLTVGARPNLRFDEQNVHKQCSVCNNHLHGNLVNYRRALIEKIGIDAVEGLEADQSTKKYSIDDLKAIKATYAAKRKELERENNK